MKPSKDFAFRRAPGKHQGVTYIALFYFMAFLALVSAFLQEHLPFVSDGTHVYMNDGEFYATFLVFVLLGIAFLLHVNRNFKIRFNAGWFIFFLLLCAANCVGTFLMEPHIAGSGLTFTDAVTNYDITFTTLERVRWCVGFGAACFMFYCMFAIFPKIFHNYRRLHYIWYVAILVAVAAIGYSLWKEWDAYVSSFTGGAWLIGEAKSFTNNPNNFAYLMMLAVVALCFLNARRSHWYWWALIFLFGLATVIIGSGAVVASTWGMILLYVIYRFFATVKVHPVRASLGLALFIGAIVTALVLVLTEVGPADFFIARLGQFMKNYVFSSDLHLRLRTWETIFGICADPMKLVFGVGDRQALFYLGAIEFLPEESLISYAHNGFMQALFNGGLIRVAAYLILIIRFGYMAVCSLKGKSRLGWTAIIAFVALLARGMVETTGLLSAEGNGLSWFFIVVLPIEVDRFLAKHPEVAQYEEEARADVEKPHFQYQYSPLRCAKLSFLYLTPIAVIALAFMPHYFAHYGIATPISYYVLWAVTYLSLPFAMYCVGHHADHIDRYVYGNLTVIAYIGLSVGGTIGCVYVPWIGYPLAGGALFIAVLAFLLHARSVVHVRAPLVLSAYLPFVLIGGLMAAPGVACYFIPEDQYTIYVPIMGAIASLMVYLCFMVAPSGQDLAYPLGHRICAWDCRRTAIGIFKERKLVARQDKYMTKKPKPKAPAKTFRVHR